MATWCLRLAWDGRSYVGWQRQAQPNSIQQVLEEALARVLGGHEVRLRAAGRTDAGVHALDQVVSFTTAVERSPRAIQEGLNANLPADIACLQARVAADDFDPRGWCRRKHYRYRLLERRARCPFREGRAWHLRRPLDIAAMSEAAVHLTGRHDWSSFRAAGCTANNPVRRVEAVQVSRPDEHPDEIWIDVRGNGFLRHMVRIMTGTLVEVGQGRRSPESVLIARDQLSRAATGPTAPAHGLWLVEVVLADGPVESDGGVPDSQV